MKKLYLICLILSLLVLGGMTARCGDKHIAPPALNGGNGNGGGEDEDEDEDIDAGKVPGFLPGYPKGLSVVPFTDELGKSKCSGFYAVADFAHNPNLAFRPQFSNAKKPTAYCTDFKGGTPYVVTNAGFFGGKTSLSLVVDNGTVKPATTVESFKKSDGTYVDYYPVRAALGQMADGSFDVAWIYCMPSDLNRPYAFPSALGNDERTETFMTEAPATDTPGARKWDVKYAIGAGPMLVHNKKNVAVDSYWKEVLDHGGVSGTSRQPRTAIGYTDDNKLVLLVCDGRGENGSVGFTLAELADKFIELGCVGAINLDGGGSSTFVGKDGKILNRPSDTPDTQGAAIVQRDVPTAVVIAETE